ncbi:hypothetical protein [Lactobacillus acetotolerans]|uniref:hypothetical protein n=1 Tax=Lactobacillus acetotolerans TaxID=1600 RepID=UPI0007B81A1A|nr:hypothetical protein [Lactobacillus acetotolerans]QGV04079.1 hypothetical protein GJR85_00985 [Lactobacillus acetotolerans]
MKNEDDLSPGLGLGITFIIIGCIIPWLFSNNFMLLISTLIVAIGIGGTGIEIAKLTQKNEFQYLSVGLAFILISIYFLTIINNSWGEPYS